MTEHGRQLRKAAYDHDAIDETIHLTKLAYSLDNFAIAVDVSKEKIRQHIERGELVPSYVDSKPLIMREEGMRWLRARPAEKVAS